MIGYEINFAAHQQVEGCIGQGQSKTNGDIMDGEEHVFVLEGRRNACYFILANQGPAIFQFRKRKVRDAGFGRISQHL